MRSVHSEQSLASTKTQQLINNLVQKSYSKIPILEGQLDEETLTKTWGAFGLYLSRQLRMGRGINIPHFGTFTFSAPECNLNGVTNPIERDKQFRVPVFLISKEFVHGWPLKTGIFIDNHIRPFNVQTSGSISITKVNFTEIAQYADQNKETVKISFERIIRQLADLTRQKQNSDMEIPGIGVFQVRGGIAAVHFDQFLVQNVKGVPKRPLSERKKKGEMNITADRLNMLDNSSRIGPDAEHYLKTRLGIDIDQLSTKMRKSKLFHFEKITIPKIDEKKNEKKKINLQSIALIHQVLNIKKTILKFKLINYYKFKQIGRPYTAARNASAVNLNGSQTMQRPATSTSLRQSAINLKQPELGPLEFGLKRLKFWIRQNCFNAQDAFLEMCNNALGRTKYQKVKVDYKQFFEAVNKMELDLNELQAQELFMKLDDNKDGYINYHDWKVTIKDDNDHLKYIKDVIYKRQLHTDDVLKTMGLDREHPPINKTQLKDALKKLDLTLTDIKAVRVAQILLGLDEYISMYDLARTFDCTEEDDKIFDPSWFKDILYKIKQKINALENPNEIRESFENYDEHNEGILDTANFKTCLMRSSLKLTVKEINRIVRYLPKVKVNNIDYYNFLKVVDRVDINASAPDAVSDISEFAVKLGKFIKEKRFTVPSFLKTVRRFSFVLDSSNNIEQFVSLSQMSEFLHRNVFKGNDRVEVDYYVNELDIDCDGYIKEDDIESFLKRHTYFDQTGYVPLNQTRTMTLKSLDPRTISMNTKALYPFKPLSEAKVDTVLRDLRLKMAQKKMTSQELFNTLDSDGDGFLTIDEFSENIKKLIELSQPAIDGFFAYMDKLHTGLVDLSSFLRIMRKSVITKDKPIKEDNFNWEYEIAGKIREWFKKEGITVEDSFRAIDQNFKREINVDDVEVFLKECLKVKPEELNHAKLDRLYKLIDQYKRGKINFVDWKRFILEDFSYGLNSTVMGGQKIDNISSFDWRLNARQQLGLVLTRRFATLVQSFDVISGYRKKLLFSNFTKWVKDTDALRGFDLTDTLMQELFSDLDPHKKGHLTENDWEIAFGGFDWEHQMHEEIKEYVKQNFKSVEKAFEFFSQGNSVILQDSFYKAVNSILPKRFIESDLKDLWNYVSQNQPTADLNKFKMAFQKFIPHYERTQEYEQENIRVKTAGPLSSLSKSTAQIFANGISDSKLKGYSSTGYGASFGNNSNLINNDDEVFEEKLLAKIRRLLRPTIKSVSNILESLDVNKTGYITNLEFRNAMKTLNLGLVQNEVDLLLNVCEIDGRVNIQQFLKFIDFTQSDKKIVQRSILKLREITNQVYTFLLSPKDAFRMFDVDSKGYLDFDQFSNFITRLSQLAGQDMPPYAIIKDLFEYIDQKRDGIIDQAEWMDIFNKFEYAPQASINKRFISKANIYNLNKRPSTSFNPQTLKELPHNKYNLEYHTDNYPLNVKNEKLHIITDKQKYGKMNYFFDEVEKQPEPKPVGDNLFNKVLGEWGKTKEFDKAIISIGKNRRFLLEMFNSLYQRNIPITFERAKAIIAQMLRNSGQQHVKEEAWPILLKFAERNGVIDYKFLLEVYKERIQHIDRNPIIHRNKSMQIISS